MACIIAFVATPGTMDLVLGRRRAESPNGLTQRPSGQRPSGQSQPSGEQGVAMSETVDALVLDLLEWIGPTPRPYDEVLDAWRTSCPRLPVWEEANGAASWCASTGPERAS